MSDRPAYPMTTRQASVLRVIRNYHAQRGYPPTMRVTAELLGLKSAANIQRIIFELVERGLLVYRPHEGGEYWPVEKEVE